MGGMIFGLPADFRQIGRWISHWFGWRSAPGLQGLAGWRRRPLSHP
jgi:hypothetical protein